MRVVGGEVARGALWRTEQLCSITSHYSLVWHAEGGKLKLYLPHSFSVRVLDVIYIPPLRHTCIDLDLELS